ncbi:MAG: hypothetical protein Q9195_004487 [Heterodermia aff. obscurata]
MEPDWRKTASKVQDYRVQSLQKVHPPLPEIPIDLPKGITHLPQQLLSQREMVITDSSPECLLSYLIAGKWSSDEVTRAYLRRAALAQELVNCITELLPEQALSRARELDLFIKENKRPMGPLHGLPISVKEHIHMKGLTCNAGFIAWADEVATDDALILKILWKAGCIFYARTTEPQSLMHLETSSNLYGTTVNPFNRDMTSGGSSGGEGALLGLRGSCLGIGSDIGGSIRSPAANNGLYGFRPTARRLPMGGSSFSRNGGSYIAATDGPLSTSLEGIELFMETVLAAKPWFTDTALVAMPWRKTEKLDDHLYGKKLKIAIMWSDNVVTPHPSVTRALTAMSSQLKSISNVEVVEWKPYEHRLAWEIIWNLLDYPALIFPATKVDAAVDHWPKDYKPMNEQDEYNHDLYNPVDDFDGMPIGLQLVGRPFEDEKVCVKPKYLDED